MRTGSNEGWKTWYNFASHGRGSYTEGTVLLMYAHKESGEEKQFQTVRRRTRVNWNAFDVTDSTAASDL